MCESYERDPPFPGQGYGCSIASLNNIPFHFHYTYVYSRTSLIEAFKSWQYYKCMQLPGNFKIAIMSQHTHSFCSKQL